MSASVHKQITAAFNAYAKEGVAAYAACFPDQPAAEPSHICLKFKNLSAYRYYVAATSDIADITFTKFNGKEIAWGHLKTPLQKDGLSVEWVELVEPRGEAHQFNGIASLGFTAVAATELVKIPSADKGVVFRFQPKAVHP